MEWIGSGRFLIPVIIQVSLFRLSFDIVLAGNSLLGFQDEMFFGGRPERNRSFPQVFTICAYSVTGRTGQR